MKRNNYFLLLFALFALVQTAWPQNATPSTDLELLFWNSNKAFFRFNYPSTSATGEPIVLSSALACWAPENPQSGDAIEAVHIYSHYTITANSQCPTSITSNSLDFTILSTMLTGSNYNAAHPFQSVVTRSLVIMPDYEGYGITSDMTHPYLTEAVTAKQVVDAVIYGLALYRKLNGESHTLPLSDNWRSFSIGYSQGGAVSLAVHRHIEQNHLSNQLHFRGTLCGDGPYDLMATLHYYLYDDGTSYGVTTDHRENQATLPVVLPLILKGMIDGDLAMANYTIGDYLSESFLATGIMDWLASKTMTNDDIVAAWLQQLRNGSTHVLGTTYPAPANMSEMFFEKTVPGLFLSSTVVWVNLDKVFNPGFYEYLTDTTNFNSVPTTTGNAYQDMHRALVNNGLCTGWEPQHRIQFAHSKADMVVPYGNYLSFRDAHPEGENEMYRVNYTFSLSDHQAAGTAYMLGLSNGFIDSFQWLDESPVMPPTIETQTLTLQTGWSWVSSYILYGDSTLSEIQDQIDNMNVTGLIKSQNAFVSNQGGFWAGSLNELDNSQMYMINLDQPISLTLSGDLADPLSHPVTLNPGWNWISFLSLQEMSLEDVVGQLTPTDGDIIKSQNAFASYNASMNAWVGSLKTLIPGQGYMYLNYGEQKAITYPGLR